MATLEEFGAAHEIRASVYTLIRAMRREATGHLARATNPINVNVPVLADDMRRVATVAKARLDRITAFAARNSAVFSGALAVIGVTVGQANTLKNALVAVCDHTLAASLTTAQECATEAQYVLDNVPAYDGVDD